MNNKEINTVDTAFARKASEQAGVDLFACFQCEKCTNGCPVTFAMDEPPHAIIRMVQLGLVDDIAASKTPWICASCETCYTRCPNQIDIPRLMDWLKRQALNTEGAAVNHDVANFHKTFLDNIKANGRVYETSLMGAIQIKSMLGEKGLDTTEIMDNMKLGIKMLSKGRLSLLPHKTKGLDKVKKLF